MKKRTIVALLLVVFVVLSFGCAKGPQWKDGTYTGTGEGLQDDIIVSVTVKDGKISTVDVVEHRESPGVSEPAIEQIPEMIIEKQTHEVDVVAGVTYTSNGIIQAVEAALAQAK